MIGVLIGSRMALQGPYPSVDHDERAVHDGMKRIEKSIRPYRTKEHRVSSVVQHSSGIWSCCEIPTATIERTDIELGSSCRSAVAPVQPRR